MVSLLEEIRLAPKILGPGEGFRYSMGSEQITVKLGSADTNGQFAFAEVHIPEPGFGPPYHVHTQEDEMFQVLEGELIVVVDGVRHVVPAGGIAFAPRNIPHRFESGPNGVRFNVMITGSNFERFHARYTEAFERGDMASLPAIAAEHGIAFVQEA
jgi:quercetin dioxygenase-like cupin family protein